MDDPICASCGRGLSLEEIERGSFKQLGGRVYCVECVGKMRRVGPTVCPQCGNHDTPLYNGKTYVCRKCGADLSRKAAPAKTKRPAATARARKPMKKCPYCAATIPAETLKCRYCGSLLTREARDLEVSSAQNLRLRFWLGSLLTASLFLFVLLVYVLVQRPSPTARPMATTPPASAKPQTSREADPLTKEVVALRRELAALKAQQARAPRVARPAAPRTRTRPATTRPKKPPRTRPAPKPTPAKPRVTKPTPLRPAVPKPAVVKPTPKPTPPKPAASAKPTEADRAAAAYPAFAARLAKLKAQRDYGAAVAACRQFLALHLDTPSGAKATAAQNAVRSAIEKVRTDHITRFQAALKKNDLKAARAVAADLDRYKAPEIAEDRTRMLAELKATTRKPARDQAKYLTQWKVPPNVGRLLTELRRHDDANARSRAAKQLGRLGHSAAIMGLMRAANDPDWYVAMSVIDALAAIGDPIALPTVAHRTKASFPGTYHRAAIACRTLAQADKKKYAEAWKLVDTKAVAREAMEALTLISKEESNVTSRFRIALIDTLAFLDAKNAVPAIRAVLKTKDKAVRAAANAAIAKLTGVPTPKPPAKPKTVAKPKPTLPKPATPKKPAPAKTIVAPKPVLPTPAAAPEPAPPTPAKPEPAPTVKATKPAPVVKPQPKEPAPKHSIPPGALSGKVTPMADGKSLAIRLPSKHGLNKGDKIELARNGKPMCIVQVVQVDATRVVGNVVKQIDKSPPSAGTGITITLAK